MFELTINDTRLSAHVSADTPLLWVLRDEFQLNGTKFGCGKGLCGACTVLIDGIPTRTCTISVGAAVGKRIVTIEGLARNGQLHPVQQAWIQVDVPQCGYCQSGQILSAVALLEANTDPDDSAIDRAINNICRCGTYPEIRQAVKLAARLVRKGAPA